MSIGTGIKLLRLKKGLTQKQLGDLCGMADSAIRRYESNRGNPTEKTIKKIAEALGVSDIRMMDVDSIEELEALQFSQDVLNDVYEKQKENEAKLLLEFRKLSDHGKDVAIKRVAELAKISEYNDDLYWKELVSKDPEKAMKFLMNGKKREE